MAQVIWTKHLHQRVKERGIDPRHLDKTIRFPDKVIVSKTTGSKKHIKDISGQRITATIKKKGNDWIVTSAWQKPNYQPSKKPSLSFWQRLLKLIFP